MQEFFQQVASGLADGSIYASLALALVLIYRATEIVNFAQGEMAMFTTYIAWSLIEHHGLASWLWGPDEKIFPSPFPNASWDVGGVKIAQQDVGVIAVTLGTVVLLWLFFTYTRIGLAMRSAAVAPDAARLLGVRVSWMLALGWGLAAVLGAVAGMMAAPSLFVFTPNFMQVILIYAFAAAVLGGIESPVGAVIGGLALGVTINLLGTYVGFVTEELRLPVALGILLVVLLVRPAGLFGRVVVRRV